MLFENEVPYLDMVMNIPGLEYLNKGMKMDMDKETEGFIRGNMFDNEYDPYKNYTYQMPKLSSQRERDMFEIMKQSFFINDYNLYLDLHPDDMRILEKYKEAAKCLDEKVEMFAKKYGPLSITQSNYPTFKWIESPWPWDKEDGKYV